METSALKSFAAWARTELIAQVSARLEAVIGESSKARREHATAVARLDEDILTLGRAEVIDRVAYTWFNRLIALRYMDAHGYTGTGVVSPAGGATVGQPEVLADAKRGTFDTNVISDADARLIIDLIDAKIPSRDPQSEAYLLLLKAYCAHWNAAMPFMFEPAGDYTELLIPANLLTDDSVLARIPQALPVEACQDVEVIGWLYQFYIAERKDEVFASFKNKKKAGAAEIPAATQLFTPHWIVRYLVENSLGRLWLLNHPESRLADHMEYYIPPVDEDTDYLKIETPQDLTVLDPACGSGHMLTYAFDLLAAIYEEEGYGTSEIPSLILENNLVGLEIDSRAASLAAFALAMKARARQRTFFRRGVTPKVCVIEPVGFTDAEITQLVGADAGKAERDAWRVFEHADVFGSLIQPDAALLPAMRERATEIGGTGGDLLSAGLASRAHQVVAQADYLNRAYAVVVANPPYMGSKNMTPLMANFAKAHFPDSKADLYAMFIERNLRFAQAVGMVAMITMQSWMFITSFEALRSSLLAHHTLDTMLHLGPRAFDSIGGEVVSSTAFVLSNGHTAGHRGVYVRLVEGNNEDSKKKLLKEALAKHDRENQWFVTTPQNFDAVPGSPIAYWLSPRLAKTFTHDKQLSEITEPRVGLQTSDDQRFLRSWFEVSFNRIGLGCADREEAQSTGKKWFPFNKGGTFRKWYGNIEHVVNWQSDGIEIRTTLNKDGKVAARAQNVDHYFHRAVSWSAISTGDPAFRYYPIGFIPSNAGMVCYGKKDLLLSVIPILNSSVAIKIFNILTPTINLGVGEVSRFPLNENATIDKDITLETIDVSRRDWDSFETAWDFGASPLKTSYDENDNMLLFKLFTQLSEFYARIAREQQQREARNNELVAKAYGLDGEVPTDVPLDRVSLTRNVEFRYGAGKTPEEYATLEHYDLASDLVSYAVGCMFGRYSLDKPGLILANQGDTLDDYLAQIPEPTFMPDKDGVLPVLDGDWFEDDIVDRFRAFLRAAFGDEHFAANLRFIEQTLGVDTIRDYFINSRGKSKFYDDHIKRYKKRPIYWLFSSPKGSFNALIYLHRYTKYTPSLVLTEYLREYMAKLRARITTVEAQIPTEEGRRQTRLIKELEQLNQVLAELTDYEREVVYPLAAKRLELDLDDGVKANYPKLRPALRKVTGLEGK